MAEKCALNRVERLVDTSPELTERMAAAVEAEFTVDPVEATAEAIEGQLEDASAKIDAITVRRMLVEDIKTSVRDLELDPEEAGDIAAKALEEAGLAVPMNGDVPDLNRMDVEPLQVLVHRFTQIQRETLPPLPEPEPPPPARPEPEPPPPARPEPVRYTPEPPPKPEKVNPLSCRKIDGNEGKPVVHILDPLKLTKPSPLYRVRVGYRGQRRGGRLHGCRWRAVVSGRAGGGRPLRARAGTGRDPGRHQGCRGSSGTDRFLERRRGRVAQTRSA